MNNAALQRTILIRMIAGTGGRILFGASLVEAISSQSASYPGNLRLGQAGVSRGSNAVMPAGGKRDWRRKKSESARSREAGDKLWALFERAWVVRVSPLE
jgi:hypothetical protein